VSRYHQATHEKVIVVNPETDKKEIKFRKKEKLVLPNSKTPGGMTKKMARGGRAENPISRSTGKGGKVKPGSKAANRRKSYCARSLGQLKRSSAKTRNDPNSRIRQARRRWKC